MEYFVFTGFMILFSILIILFLIRFMKKTLKKVTNCDYNTNALIKIFFKRIDEVPEFEKTVILSAFLYLVLNSAVILLSLFLGFLEIF